MKLKKAAMFGLDARIALAIFGALSVISGAALYSAIQNARSTALLVEMNELSKAWEQYYLDTGQLIPLVPTTSYFIASSNILSNVAGVSGWKGPYISGYEISNPTGTNTYDNQILYRKGDKFLNVIYYYATNGHDIVCTSKDCYVWGRVDVPCSEKSIVEKIDEKLDAANGLSSGLVRFDDKLNDCKYTQRFFSVSNLK